MKSSSRFRISCLGCCSPKMSRPETFLRSVSLMDQAGECRKGGVSEIIAMIYLELAFALIFLAKELIEERAGKKIVFLAVLIGEDVGMAFLWRVFSAKKNIWEAIRTYKLVIEVLLAYFLLYESISKEQAFFLGIYLILGNGLACATKNYLSLLRLSTILIVFSFSRLSDTDNIILAIGNFAVCLTLCLFHCFFTKDSRKDSHSLPSLLLNQVIPTGTLVLRRISPGAQETSLLTETLQLRLEYANETAKQDYDLSNIEEIIAFIKELKEVNRGLGEKPLDLIDGDPKMTQLFEDQNPLFDLLKSFGEGVSFNTRIPTVFFAFCPRKHVPLRLTVVFFNLGDEKLIYLSAERSLALMEIKSLKEVSQRKDQLLAAVSHDLRSPLSGILTFVNHARSADLASERNKYLDYARINADLLMSMINDLLDYSALNNGNISLSISDVPLNQILTEIFELMRTQAEMKGLILRISNELLGENIVMQSDGRRIKQILINLLTNSIKFTMKGGVELKVRKSRMKDVINFEVIDSGIGIKPEIIGFLGKEYATFDTDNGLNKYGVGLGLSICRKLVKLMGPCEDLFLSSKYGHGTKIGFLLYERIQEQPTLSLRTILSISPRKKRFFGEKFKFSMPSFSENPIPRFEEVRVRSPQLRMPNEKLREEQIAEPDSVKIEVEISKNQEYIVKNNSWPNRSPSEKKALNSVEKKLSLSEFNFQMETRRSLLRVESKNFNNFHPGQQDSLKNAFFPSEPKFRNPDLGTLFSPFESFMFESENSSFFCEGEVGLKDRNMMHVTLPLPSIPQPKGKNKIRVLLVDDNPFNLLILKSFLWKRVADYEIMIDSAVNGLDAINLFRKSNDLESSDPYRFIFMDCVMPIKDGYSAASEIKGLISKGELYDVIIIAVTGNGGVEEEKRCLECGMDDFLMKPVQEKELLELIGFYVNRFDIK